ncbi:uncharacterized [Tachysurus ichikawai]
MSDVLMQHPRVLPPCPVREPVEDPLKCADLTDVFTQECLVLNTELGRGHAPEITCFIAPPSLMIRCNTAAALTLGITLGCRAWNPHHIFTALTKMR